MKLKDRLRELRGERSQKQLIDEFEKATEIRLKQNSYSNWENGREPSLEMLVKLADFHGVTMDYLVGRTDYIQTEYRQANIDTGLTEAAIRGIQKIRDESTETDNKIAVLNYLLELENTTSCLYDTKLSDMLSMIGTYRNNTELEEMINKSSLSVMERKELSTLSKIGLESSIIHDIKVMVSDWIDMYKFSNKTID